MDNHMIEALKKRISTEPSVLFLGQDYLRSKTGENLFYHAANQKLCGGKLQGKTDLSELWDALNGGKALTPADFADLGQILHDIPEQEWLRKILGMHWSMVMTSAVDGAMFQCVGDDFVMSTVSMDQRIFNRSYITKRILHISALYGSVGGGEDDLPPAECSARAFRPFKKKINDRVNWIYSNILADYGILIIDGWDPDHDWLDGLLELAGDMPDRSIYLFGATGRIMENEDVGSLRECGILLTDERTFAQALEETGFFEEADTWEEEDMQNENGHMITLNAGKTRVLAPSNARTRLDSHITVLYDDIWLGKNDKDIDTEKLYAQFQKQTDQPVWHLYSDRYGFYFKRTQDELLIKTVDNELHSGSYKRRYIMLEGNSNTGKTASLVRLAYEERNHVPVIYISGIPNQPDWMEDLKKFIKEQFVEKQSAAKGIDSVLVIWDANTDFNASQRCKQLQNTLRECNTVVVGSAYPLKWDDQRSKSYYKDTAGNHHLLLTAKLDKNETKSLYASIKKINNDLYERLQKKEKTSTYLLHVLQQMIRLRYQEEWKEVAAALQTRFNQEVDSSEEYADTKLKKYLEEMEEKVDAEIQKYGVASSWQIQLEQIRIRYFGEEGIEPENREKTEDPEKTGNLERIEKLKRMEKRIQVLNQILAVAGEFSVDIPLSLILRMVSDGRQRIFSDEQLFLVDIIQNDSLLRHMRDDEGYMSVSFRHPSEAELYLENNFGNDGDEREREEVRILTEMIRECKWDDELENLSVLSLVRSFGPNSWGTLDHPRRLNTRHYSKYDKWWKEIALELKGASDGQPETVLVYAVLIRSSCRDRLKQLEAETVREEAAIQKEKKDCIQEFNEAKEELRNTIEIHDQNNKNQYCRLLGEMCTNLVFDMRNGVSECENSFADLRYYFSLAVKNWADNNSQNLFTKNSLLDIWLNGVYHYFRMKSGDSDPMADPKCAAVIADSINYIDELLDLTEEGFDKARLLDKVDTMYQYAGSDRLKDFEEKLERSNNDTFLYLTAWRCWRPSTGFSMDPESLDDYMKNIINNLYLLPDDLDRREDYREQMGVLKEQAKIAAINAIEILENKKKLIERSRSTRCINMLIRAKWLAYTGNLPLEAKQCPSVETLQWEEIGGLCKKYIEYADRRGEQLRTAPVLLRMVYVWCFTKDRDEFEDLRNRQNMLSTNDWYFERICLCRPGTDEPKQFKINLQLKRGTSDKYVATVVSSFDTDGREQEERDAIDNNIRGKQVHVPVAIAQTLLGSEFGNEKYNVGQPVIIWFNAKGPQIGLQRQKGGK